MSGLNKRRRTRLSKLAIACSMALAIPAVASTDISNTEYYTYWHDYVVNGTDNGYMYRGYIGNYSTDNNHFVYSNIDRARVHGVLSTHYLGYPGATTNIVNISNSIINGMITSDCLTSDNCTDIPNDTTRTPLTLNISNTTIDDTYERYDDNAAHGTNTGLNHPILSTFAWGNAITLSQEANVNVSAKSHIAGMTFHQGYGYVGTTEATPIHYYVNVRVLDSVITSGAYSELKTTGFYGQSSKPSDYVGYARGSANYLDDAALIFSSAGSVASGMKNDVYLSNSTLHGNVLFSSSFHNTYHLGGTGTNGTYGWNDTDILNLTLDNGSKWIGHANSAVDTDVRKDAVNNSRWPASVTTNGLVSGNLLYQSGLFNVTLNNRSTWQNIGDSNLDLITANNSYIDTRLGHILADEITLNNGSRLDVGHGGVSTDQLNINSGSIVDLSKLGDAPLGYTAYNLYANTILADHYGELRLGEDGAFDAQEVILNNQGTLNIGTRDYVLNSNLTNQVPANALRGQHNLSNGVVAVAVNTDAMDPVTGAPTLGHLTVEGTASGDFNVRLDNATGKGSIDKYYDKEIIRTYDNANATFYAGNEIDLGAYRYVAEQRGDSVVLAQRDLSSSANAALSVPSSNANVSHLEYDTVNNRQTNLRHLKGNDMGGVWVSYFGGGFDADNGRHGVEYDQKVHGLMVGADRVLQTGSGYSWLLGMSASFAKSNLDLNNADVDQNSQSARVYSSLLFDNNVFIDGTLSFSRFSNDINSIMSDGKHNKGDTDNNAWGAGLKVGYDWEFQPNSFLTPYAGISAVFVGDESYTMSNGMRVSDQSYDSVRYEIGADLGHNFVMGDDTFTPYLKLAYMYEGASNSNGRINGDRIENDMEGSSVRVGLGALYNVNKKFSVYADSSYIGGGDATQPWSANLGVKYNF